MNEDKGKTFRELGYFASLGISVALSIVIGLALGWWLDKQFDTQPVLLLVGLAFGIAAGFSNIIRAGQKGREIDKREEEKKNK
ncbi:MAG: AtpZ/AtpI family protein [Desulfobacter sp.]|nr:MAG: AtpZ/AtpI family protein [Desulfobacter sp.]